MAVVENKSTEIGDVLVIKASVPIIGLIALSDFIDTVQTETGVKFFNREFRYSTNGLSYSAWTELTQANLQAVSIVSSDTFYVEYRYTRAGSDSVGDLQWDETEIQGTIDPGSCGETYNKSIFSDFFSCSDTGVLNWAINVLEKIYKKGIVAKYIEREKGESDEDYINFWRSLTTYFAYLVHYARKFENFDTIPSLLEVFLNQRDLETCSNENYLDNIHLSQNLYEEFSKRGTLKIVKSKFEGEPIDGELLRLICKKDCEEFLFGLTDPKYQNWWLDNSSPLFKGVSPQKYFNKTWEDKDETILPDLNKYPIVDNINTTIYTNIDKHYIKLNGVSAGTLTGIGINYKNINLNNFDLDKVIEVSSTLDYIFSFEAKQYNLNSGNLTFGILGLNKDNQIVKLISSITGLQKDTFVEKTSILKNNTVFYQLRGIIWNKTKVIDINDKLDIGIGNNLKFVEGICKIIPFILLDTEESTDPIDDGSIYLKNIKLTPLQSKYSKGFIQNQNLIQGWIKNNSAKFSKEQVEQKIRNKLIPYNSFFAVNYID